MELAGLSMISLESLERHSLVDAAKHRSVLGTLLACVSAMGIGACAPSPTMEKTRPAISPKDFALVPCGAAWADAPCALAIAGGKRVLFGAPTGTASSLTQEDLRGLDVVMLFSLRARDIEGLGEVRNESWRAGRSQALRVVGPEGTTAMVDALNRVFEQSDALRIVEEGIPKGGYDAAVLEGVEWPVDAPDATVFDTGDVSVRIFQDTYVATYFEQVEGEGYNYYAFLTGCGGRAPLDQLANTQTTMVDINCLDDAGIKWPLTETIFIKD